MPKQVRLRRGTTAQHASFTGADGEVTVDTTKRALVLHDGVTAGGRPIEMTGRRLFSATSNSLNTGTSAVSLFGTGQGSLVVPANFITAGMVLWARFYGYISTTGSPGNMTLAILFPASAAGFIKTPPASLSLGMFMCEAHFRCAVAGPSGSANVRIWAMFANSSTGVPVFYYASDDIDLDTTPSIAFDVTGQFANSGQTLRIEQGTLEVVR